MTHNKSLQQTLDPAGPLAVAKAPSASIAAEPRRYAAQETPPLAGTAGPVCRRSDSADSVRY